MTPDLNTRLDHIDHLLNIATHRTARGTGAQRDILRTTPGLVAFGSYPCQELAAVAAALETP